MKGLSPITTQTSTQHSATSTSKLMQSAHEFEAQMMKELLRPLREADASDGSDSGEDGIGTAGAIGDFASETLARAISENGGFGIASMIAKQLTPVCNQNETVPVTGMLLGNTAMKLAE